MNSHKCFLYNEPIFRIEVTAAGRDKVQLKPGSKETLQRAARAGVSTHICSVNWSQELVGGAVEGAAEEPLEGVEIHCNDLAEEGGISTGQIVR